MRNNEINYIVDTLSNTSAFSELGLKFTGYDYRKGSAILGESFVLNFVNNNRSIQVIYYPQVQESDFFIVNIVNLENMNTFNLDDWLKKHNLAERIDKFKLSSFQGEKVSQVRSFSSYLSDVLLNKELSSMLKGESWETVPFDWMGMK